MDTFKHRAPLFLVIDHFDSFTHNILNLLHLTTAAVSGASSEKIWCLPYGSSAIFPLVNDCTRHRHLLRIVLSPGPKQPSAVPESIKLYQRYRHVYPFLGICLGHQIMGVSEGYSLGKTKMLAHGGVRKVNFLAHSGYDDIMQDHIFAIYNSLRLSHQANHSDHPNRLDVIAYDELGEIAALGPLLNDQQGLRPPHLSVQFHPESFLSTKGPQLMTRWHQLVNSYQRHINWLDGSS
ncbi:MAG: aminodeoxychorismate/anthranilate synthase component II [Proteobacteria bacterium]|nr:aminodeoxychorismate/anthranilate synthase component II [Pseudomonadota bacterium]